MQHDSRFWWERADRHYDAEGRFCFGGIEVSELVAQLGTGVILISHDLGVIAEFTDYVLVMKDGEVVESGRTVDVVAAPKHPYTQKLLAAVRQLEGDEPDQEVALAPAAG